MKTSLSKSKIKLLRVEKAKFELDRELKTQFINELDILYVLGKDVNYGVSKEKTSFRHQILKDIMNCPFILCDQEYLSTNIKEMLPYILISRFNIEKDELNYQFENFYIDEETYNKELEELEYFYFKSSEEGKKIYYEHFQKTK